jgi:hypothetical protein
MSIINWPLTGLILGLVFLLVFRKPIESLLSRTKKIGAQGIEAEALQVTTPQETPKIDPLATAPAVADDLLLESDSPFVREIESLIRQTAKAYTDSGNRERVLVHYLAATAIRWLFERAYGLIFGSQLSLLRILNERPGLPTDEVRTYFYDTAVSTYPHTYANYSFDQWLSFMTSQVLVCVKDGRVHITIRGREFLKFLIQEGYPTTTKAG